MIVQTSEVREGTVADLPAIMGLIERAQGKMGPPYLQTGPNVTAACIRSDLARPSTALLIAGDPPIGFCWGEAVGNGEFLVHEVCTVPGRLPFQVMVDAAKAAARARHCTKVVCLTYRPGGQRFFSRYGFRWTATLMQMEVI